MNKLLVTRNRKKSTEQGFSIAVSTGFGLIIMIIGLTLMGRAMKDSSVSAAQKITSRGDAAAQTGTARFMAFVASNPKLATYPVCTARNTSGTCTDNGATVSWANASTTTTPGLTAAQIAEAKTYANWQDIDTTKPERGQFRVLSYAFSGSGTVASNVNIEGRVGQVGSGNTATKDIQTGSAEATADVYYAPAQPGTENELVYNGQNYKFSGLWLRQGGNAGQSGNIFYADGLLENTSTQPLYASNDGNRGIATTTPLKIADFLPAKPSGLTPLTLPSKSDKSVPSSTDLTNPATCSDQTINTVVTTVCRYELGDTIIKGQKLTVNTINSASTGSGTQSKPLKVVFYLTGNIDVQTGQSGINHLCKDRSGATATNCDLSNFIIYGYKATSASICNQGSSDIKAFIIAPTYAVGGNAAGGNSRAAASFKGAVWANNWDGSNGPCKGNGTSNQSMVAQQGSWNDVANWGDGFKITRQPTAIVTPSPIPAPTIVQATPAKPATFGRQAAAIPTPTGSPY